MSPLTQADHTTDNRDILKQHNAGLTKFTEAPGQCAERQHAGSDRVDAPKEQKIRHTAEGTAIPASKHNNPQRLKDVRAPKSSTADPYLSSSKKDKRKKDREAASKWSEIVDGLDKLDLADRFKEMLSQYDAREEQYHRHEAEHQLLLLNRIYAHFKEQIADEFVHMDEHRALQLENIKLQQSIGDVQKQLFELKQEIATVSKASNNTEHNAKAFFLRVNGLPDTVDMLSGEVKDLDARVVHDVQKLREYREVLARTIDRNARSAAVASTPVGTTAPPTTHVSSRMRRREAPQADYAPQYNTDSAAEQAYDNSYMATYAPAPTYEYPLYHQPGHPVSGGASNVAPRDRRRLLRSRRRAAPYDDSDMQELPDFLRWYSPDP